MTGTMTSVGLDVHARSIDAAAICVQTGEVTRTRFGGAPGPVLGVIFMLRLRQLPEAIKIAHGRK